MQTKTNKNNHDTFFVSPFHQVQQMEIVRESLKENNKRIALRNLDKEPGFHQEKIKLAELFEEVNKVTDEYKALRQRYGRILKQKNNRLIAIFSLCSIR